MSMNLLQFFSLTLVGELRRENFCAEIQNPLATPVRIIMFRCHGQKGNQEWRMKVGSIMLLQGSNWVAEHHHSLSKLSAMKRILSLMQNWYTAHAFFGHQVF
jgi:hypothetical protein